LNVSVPKERIKNFLVKLDQFKINERKKSNIKSVKGAQKEKDEEE
jgi:hypothetical protein